VVRRRGGVDGTPPFNKKKRQQKDKNQGGDVREERKGKYNKGVMRARRKKYKRDAEPRGSYEMMKNPNISKNRKNDNGRNENYGKKILKESRWGKTMSWGGEDLGPRGRGILHEPGGIKRKD